MYNCNNCDKLETLYFKCQKCEKLLCRKCISKGNHTCLEKSDDTFKLDVFCDDMECMETKNLKSCTKCKRKYCKIHYSKHECKYKCCIIM